MLGKTNKNIRNFKINEATKKFYQINFCECDTLLHT